MNIIGIDPALRNTGYVKITEGDSSVFSCLIQPTTESKNIMRPADILQQLRKVMNEFIEFPHEILIVMEGPSYGSRTTSLYELGELSGLLQYFFYHSNFNYIMPSPMEIKKFVTDKGNADKDLMKATLLKDYKSLKKLSMSEHEFDAFGCAQYGKAFLERLHSKKQAPLQEALMARIATAEKMISRPKEAKGKKLNAKYFLDEHLLNSLKAVYT